MSSSLLQRSIERLGPKVVYGRLTQKQRDDLRFKWRVIARPEQLAPPGDWRYWFMRFGRGGGKTRGGAEWIRERIDAGFRQIALAAQTDEDVRKKMIENPKSGLLTVFPENQRPQYFPGKKEVIFHTGAIGHIYTGSKPNRGRGSEHDTLWADEVASWQYEDAWDQLMFGLRIGDDPRACISSTPKNNRLTKKILAKKATVVTRATTYANKANLAPAFYQEIIAEYEGTRLGRQEIHAELLDDNPDALWNRERIDELRCSSIPPMRLIVVGVDPAGTATARSSETGIVAAGIGQDGHYYVLDDRSLKASPDVWATQAVACHNAHKANRIIGEVNNGGDMVGHTIKSVLEEGETIQYKSVRASRGKYTRAEPIAALYEKGKVHHVGMFADLEDQLCDWVPGDKSPDRLDALVWALTELSQKSKAANTNIVLSNKSRRSPWKD